MDEVKIWVQRLDRKRLIGFCCMLLPCAITACERVRGWGYLPFGFFSMGMSSLEK